MLQIIGSLLLGFEQTLFLILGLTYLKDSEKSEQVQGKMILSPMKRLKELGVYSFEKLTDGDTVAFSLRDEQLYKLDKCHTQVI